MQGDMRRGVRLQLRQLHRLLGQPSVWLPLLLLLVGTLSVRMVSSAMHDADPCARPPKDYLKDMQIAIYETSGYHEETMAGFVYTAERGGANTTTFRNGLRFGFGEIMNKFHDKAIESPDDMPRHIKEETFDILVLVSCETYWVQHAVQDAIKAYGPNLQVVCLHHEMWSFNHHRNNFRNVAADGRLNFLTLSGHTHDIARKEIEVWSLEDGDAGWASTPSYLFVPVFPLTPSLDPATLKRPKGLHNVAVAGNIAIPRRWPLLFKDLDADLQESPASWGYALKAPSSPGGNMTAVPLADEDPFRLHVFGRDKGDYEIPPLVRDVMTLHEGLSYTDYYRQMSEMDLMVPAFGNNEYIHKRASASIPAAIMTRVPTLINPAIALSYPFLDGSAVHVMPASQSDVDGIKRWRARLPTWPMDFPASMPEVTAPLLRAARRGANWLAGRDYWEDYHERIYEYNDRIFCRIAERSRQRRRVQAAT